uniref:BESS domain-containing protein n=1 Tax=Heliothis virescens TaxID=7102 RepID=A0A2A4IZR8_HELVI
MTEIDPEKLILAVKKRPALYTKNDPNYYSNKKHKSKLWIEVCREVYAGWDHFKPQDRVENGHELQRRWKSLRTCFTRELGMQKKEKLKREQNEPYKKRKRYEHFNLMSFLLEPEEDQNGDRDSDDSASDPLESIKHEPSGFESMHVSNSSNYEVEVEPEAETSQMNRSEPYLRSMYERSENLEDKILDMLKEIKKDEEDEDRQFMLSLVPSFRKLRAKQKFEARIEILRVLKDITFQDDDDAKSNS